MSHNLTHFTLRSNTQKENNNSMQIDTKDQYPDLRNKAGIYEPLNWGLLSISGPDRKSFLQGLVTNEIKQLVPGKGSYNLHLSPKGKILAEIWVFEREEDLLLLTPPQCKDIVQKNLDKYLIMEDAEISDLAQNEALISMHGPAAESLLCILIPENDGPSEKNTCTSEVKKRGIVSVFRTDRFGETGFELLIKKENLEAYWSKIVQNGIPVISQDTLNLRRIEAGIPDFEHELTHEVFPQEALLNHAVSFQKGCYVGQETVARLQHRGHVNRELTGFVLEGELPEQNHIQIIHEEKTVGMVTSTAYSFSLEQAIGLGFLRCEWKKPGTRLGTDCPNLEVEVAELPFVK
jgi:folate-binding protein YgfZ